MVEAGARNVPSEPWVERLSDCVFGQVTGESEDLRQLVQRLSSGLEEYPTAVRRVFGFVEFVERAETSPMAMIGALDILATLNLDGAALEQIVTELARATVASSVDAETAKDRLELLFLLTDRVRSLTTGVDLGSVTDAVATAVFGSLESLQSVDEWLGKHPDGASQQFVEGVARGTRKALQVKPDSVTDLLRLQRLVPALVEHDGSNVRAIEAPFSRLALTYRPCVRT